MDRNDFLRQMISELSRQTDQSTSTDGSLLKQKELSANAIFKKFCFDFPDMTNADEELLQLSSAVSSMDMKSVLPQISYFSLNSTLIQNVLSMISDSKSFPQDSVYSLAHVLFFHVPVQMLDCNKEQLVHLLFAGTSDSTYDWKDIFDCFYQKVVSNMEISLLSKKKDGAVGTARSCSSVIPPSQRNLTNDLIVKHALALAELFTSSARLDNEVDGTMGPESVRTFRDVAVLLSGGGAIGGRGGDDWEGVREVLESIRMKVLLFLRDVFSQYPEYLEHFGVVCDRLVDLAVQIDTQLDNAADEKMLDIPLSFPNQMYCLYLLFVSNVCTSLAKEAKTEGSGKSSNSSLFQFVTFLTRDNFRHYTLLFSVSARMSAYYKEVMMDTCAQLSDLQRDIDACHETDVNIDAEIDSFTLPETGGGAKALIRQFRTQSTTCQQVYAGTEEVLAFNNHISGVLLLCLQRLQAEHHIGIQAGDCSPLTPDVIVTSGVTTLFESEVPVDDTGIRVGSKLVGSKKPKKKIGVKTSSHAIGIDNYLTSMSILRHCLYGTPLATGLSISGANVLQSYTVNIFTCLNFSVPKLNALSDNGSITPASSSSALREYLEGYCHLLLSCHLQESGASMKDQLIGVLRGLQTYFNRNAAAIEQLVKHDRRTSIFKERVTEGMFAGYLVIVCLVLLYHRVEISGPDADTDADTDSILDLCVRFVEAYSEDSLHALLADWTIINTNPTITSANVADIDGHEDSAHALKLKDARYCPPYSLLVLLGVMNGSALAKVGRFPDLMHLLTTTNCGGGKVGINKSKETDTAGNSSASTAVIAVATPTESSGVCWAEWCNILLEHVEAVLRKINAIRDAEKGTGKCSVIVDARPLGRKLKQVRKSALEAAVGSTDATDNDNNSDSCSDSEDSGRTIPGAHSKTDKEEEIEEYGNQIALIVKHYTLLRGHAKQLKLLLLESSSSNEQEFTAAAVKGKGLLSVTSSKMD